MTVPSVTVKTRQPALVANLIAGTRLGLFLPVRREQFRFSLDQAVMLILIGVVAVTTAEYLALPPVRRFDADGVGTLATGYLVYFMALYLVVRVLARPDAFFPLVIVIEATSLVWAALYLLTAFATSRLGGGSDGFAAIVQILMSTGLYYLWPLAIWFRASRCVLDLGRWRAGLLAVALLTLTYGPTLVLPKYGLWYSEPESTAAYEPTREPLNVENVYYAQPELLRQALEPLAPQRPGIADLYFVGFAGWARQDVFLNEVRAVRALFDERFDTAGRSVALINNPKTVDELPLATASNLRRVLAELGERMDGDEDVLFLFLTSHGSENSLGVSYWPLRPNDLAPWELRDMLDDSGIKWRVVVISACHSGSFVDELEDDHTLVITASAADRNSFGCGDLNDFTYFGEAYFDQQLRRETSFVAAFDNAVETITAREGSEGFAPSRPQISIGAAIAPKLAAMEARLRGLSGSQ